MIFANYINRILSMKVIKVIATYLNDFADKLSNGDINLSKAQLKDLMETLIEMDSDILPHLQAVLLS